MSGLPVVTTSRNADAATIERARAIAQECGLDFVPRRGSNVDPAIVLEKLGAYLLQGGEITRSHPGIGMVRLRRLLRGEEHDPLVDIANVQPGDRILDATFGYGQDALLLAYAVGEQGAVEALESSPVLAALALAGMPLWPTPADDIASRIHLRRADYREALAQVPDRSFDVVFFDPMFRDPKSAAPDFATLRKLANTEPLDEGSLAHARRIARRCVVVKDAWPGRELERLGLRPYLGGKRFAAIAFGVAEPA